MSDAVALAVCSDTVTIHPSSITTARGIDSNYKPTTFDVMLRLMQQSMATVNLGAWN